MALSKAKSRPIVVGGEAYRWAFFQDSGYDSVTVQRAIGHGRKLALQVEWVRASPVTPAFVARAIEFALAAGWVPSESGAPFNASYRQGVFKAR